MTDHKKLTATCTVLFIIATGLFAKPDSIQKYIMVDQFGYRTDDKKVAVIVNPQIGFNANDEFIPGTVYEVRKWNNDEVIYSGSLTEWNRGAVDFTAGDKGWWFDFSALTLPKKNLMPKIRGLMRQPSWGTDRIRKPCICTIRVTRPLQRISQGDGWMPVTIINM
jgi:hypothetical protein